MFSCVCLTTEFGPLIKTTDPEVFKGLFKTLSASGGGDNQELSLSALQVLRRSLEFRV